MRAASRTLPEAPTARCASDSPLDTWVPGAARRPRAAVIPSRDRAPRIFRRSMRDGSIPTRHGSSLRRIGYCRRHGANVARRFPASHAFRVGLESFSVGSEVKTLHDKFVIAAIKSEFADHGGLAFHYGVLRLRGLNTAQYRARRELKRAGGKLYADVRRDHGPKESHALLAVHANENEEERV